MLVDSMTPSSTAMISIRDAASCWAPSSYSGLRSSMTCTTVRGIRKNGLICSPISMPCSVVIGSSCWETKNSSPVEVVRKWKQCSEIATSSNWLFRASPTRNIKDKNPSYGAMTACFENITVWDLGRGRESFAKMRPRSDVDKSKPVRDWSRRHTTPSGHCGVIYKGKEKSYYFHCTHRNIQAQFRYILQGHEAGLSAFVCAQRKYDSPQAGAH